MAAETLLVTERGNPHHHRIAVLVVGEELQRSRLAADDSFIPLGRAATLTLPSRDSIVAAAKELLVR
jgi:hypothetical protein